jgi:hypothetical protein
MPFILLAALLVAGAATLVWRRIGLLVQGLREPTAPGSSLRLARGLQAGILAAALLALAAGLVFAQAWLLAFGLVFLAEELYETTLLILILRSTGDA